MMPQNLIIIIMVVMEVMLMPFVNLVLALETVTELLDPFPDVLPFHPSRPGDGGGVILVGCSEVEMVSSFRDD